MKRPIPEEGGPQDAADGLLADRGKRLPFVDELVYVLEKEPISEWNKFLQGYYDRAAINPDSFDQVVQFDLSGGLDLSDGLRERNFRLLSAVYPSTRYYAFNMLDDVVGGYDAARRKLRQALSIALNQEEYIQIFSNGQGIPAQGPLPPGIFGYAEGQPGMNPAVYEWDPQPGQQRRKSIAQAKRLLTEAGYPEGPRRKRQTTRAVLRYGRPGAKRQGHAGLAAQAVCTPGYSAPGPGDRF